MTTTVIKRKIKELGSKIPYLSGLVRKTGYDVKISEIEGKCFTTSDYNKFKSNMVDAKINQKELVNNYDTSNIVKDSDINTKLVTLATKSELKSDQEKIVKLQTFDLSYFLDINFFVDDGYQNII